jgi:sugar phosphate isomerase/epimerase
MRLGGPLLAKPGDPDNWIKQLRHYGYTAAYCPVGANDDQSVRNDYVEAASKAGIVIAEVGAWSNPISPNADERDKALRRCQEQLALADEVGACCCVNIAGSRGAKWDGPDPANLTDETFEIIVESVRAIIDAVKPRRTFYTLETMPWSYPDSTGSYLRLIEAIDRKQCAVHFDPVNLICSPQRYFNNAEIISEFVSRLGAHIKSSHAKDIALAEKLTVHLDEVQPGLGNLDYRVLLKQLDGLGPDTPLLLEHLQEENQYLRAAEFVRSTAGDVDVKIL